MVGNVEVRRTGAEYWASAQSPTPLAAGDWLRSDSTGTARIEFTEGATLLLQPDALIVIDRAPSDGGDHLETKPLLVVLRGEVRGQLNDSEILIRDDNGNIVPLRSNDGKVEFRLVGSENSTEVLVSVGEATLGYGEESVVVIAGEVRVFAGGTVSEAMETLRFPKNIEPPIDARFAWTTGTTIDFQWQPVDGASAYKLELATDLSFNFSVASEVVQGTRFSRKFDNPGVYAWRVASRDADGRFGEFGFARRIFLEEEKPKEHLLLPRAGTIMGYVDTPPPVAFSWRKSDDAKRYLFVISRSADLLRETELERETTSNEITIDKLESGNFYWGVFINESTPKPLFLSARRLTVKKVRSATVETKVDPWGK